MRFGVRAEGRWQESCHPFLNDIQCVSHRCKEYKEFRAYPWDSNIWWKTAKRVKKIGGKRQNEQKKLVENGKTPIFVKNLKP